MPRPTRKITEPSKKDPKARLIVNLNDANAQPVTAKSRVAVAGIAKKGLHCTAAGKDGEVTRFTFELPAGDYKVRVECKGYEEADFLVTVRQESELVRDVLLNWEPVASGKGNPGDERKLVDCRFQQFVEQRKLASGEFPSDGRQLALEQKRRMLDPDVINALLSVKPIANPIPNGSFGNIDSCVQVTARNRKRPFQRALLKIPYSKEKLGWVDPATLRVFEVQTKRHQFRLIPESGADSDRQCAYAYIDNPGEYAVIGLPRNEAILETIRVFSRLKPPAGKGGPGSLQDRICQSLLGRQV